MASVVMTPLGRAALRAREGEVLTAYKDSVGVWTIGVGITSASGLIKVVPGLTITAAQSDDLFSRALGQYIAPVAELGVALADHQADALISLCFNIGPAAFRRSSVARRLKINDVNGAADAILMWNRPTEIIPCRKGEYDQFRTPYHVSRPFARRGDARPVSAPEFVLTPTGPVFPPAPRKPAVPLPPMASPTSPARTEGEQRAGGPGDTVVGGIVRHKQRTEPGHIGISGALRLLKTSSARLGARVAYAFSSDGDDDRIIVKFGPEWRRFIRAQTPDRLTALNEVIDDRIEKRAPGLVGSGPISLAWRARL